MIHARRIVADGLPRVAGAAGIGVFASHFAGPAGVNPDGLGALILASFASRQFLVGSLVALFMAALAPWVWRRCGLAGTACGNVVRAAWRPLWVGAALPLLAVVLGPLAVRSLAPTLLVLGIGLGGMAAAWRLLALRDDTARARDGVLLAIVATTLAVAAVLAWPVPQGDEPHYLLVAHSLWEDGDLDVADEYRDNEYRGFHQDLLSPHYKPGLLPGSRYSMHGVGYPLVLLPAYVLGGLVSDHASIVLPRIFQAFVYGLFAWLLWHALSAWVSPVAATRGVMATVFLAPLPFAPPHLFPEIFTMTASLAAFWGLSRTDRGSRVLAALMIAVLPWLGVKYIPMSAALVIAAGIAWRLPLRRLALPLGALLISLLAHGFFTYQLYGSFSPSAIYLGSDPDFARQPGYGADWRAYLADWPAALRTLIAYFFDQREGLLFYGPHYLLAASGLPWLLRRGRLFVALAIVVAAHLGPYALSQQLGGHSPPARPLMPVLWVLAVPLAAGLAMIPPIRVAQLRGVVLAVAGVWTAFLMSHAYLLPHDYGVLQSWPIRALSAHGSELWRWFPRWIRVPDWDVSTAAAWLVAALCLAAWMAIRCVPAKFRAVAAPPLMPAWSAATLALVGAAALSAYVATTALDDTHRGAPMSAGVMAYVRESIPSTAWAEPDGVWVRPGGFREIVLETDAASNVTTLFARSLVPTWVEVRTQGQLIEAPVTPANPLRRALDAGGGWYRDGKRYYVLHVRVRDGIAPARLDGGADQRQLGVFVRVQR